MICQYPFRGFLRNIWRRIIYNTAKAYSAKWQAGILILDKKFPSREFVILVIVAQAMALAFTDTPRNCVW